MSKKTLPDGYTFLLAAGEIDFVQKSTKRPNALRCGQELLRISNMNGSYEKLPDDFRAHMRDFVGSTCDHETAQRLGDIGDKLRRLTELDEGTRKEVRAQCSALSRLWPMEPGALAISDE